MTGVLCALAGGVAGARPELPASLTASESDFGGATASIAFNTNGTITNQVGVSLGNWTDKPGLANGADFRVKYDWTGGFNLTNYPAGASDNIYTANISVNRIFQLTRGSVGSSSSTGTFTVEKITTGETDTASGSFTAIGT